jgi:CheY-like chemotaxis protein
LIALTASAMQGDRERFLEGGCDDYMSKPFRALDLVEMINKYTVLVEAITLASSLHRSEVHAVDEIENDDLADTAELSFEPGQDESAWAMATESAELQQSVAEQAEEKPAEPVVASNPGAAGPIGSKEPGSKSGKTLDDIKASIMGVINPDNLKPVDPNSHQG